jgi:hypothetical protein
MGEMTGPTVLLVVGAAAFAGTVLGGLVCAGAIYLGQCRQLRVSRVMGDLDRREDIYARFVEQASEMWLDAFETPHDPGNLIGLAIIAGRIRLVSTRPVLDAAEAVVSFLIETSQRPPADLRQMVAKTPQQFIAPMTAFTAACRVERERMMWGL